jgi:hypothetical protein
MSSMNSVTDVNRHVSHLSMNNEEQQKLDSASRSDYYNQKLNYVDDAGQNSYRDLPRQHVEYGSEFDKGQRLRSSQSSRGFAGLQKNVDQRMAYQGREAGITVNVRKEEPKESSHQKNDRGFTGSSSEISTEMENRPLMPQKQARPGFMSYWKSKNEAAASAKPPIRAQPKNQQFFATQKIEEEHVDNYHSRDSRGSSKSMNKSRISSKIEEMRRIQ